MPDAYAHTTINGKLLDAASASLVRAAEADLGYQLTILQGIGGASASAGTHTRGRCIDFSPYDATRKLRVMKNLGVAGWHRARLSGVWPEHIHVCVILESRSNERGIAPVGFRQIAAFDAHRDGLISNNHDSSYHPVPKRVWHYPPSKEAAPVSLNSVQKMRNKLVEAQADLRAAATLAERVPSHRRVVRAQGLTARAMARSLSGVLRILPRR